jgi:hypothetical protein
MSEEVIPGPALAEPQSEARDTIATCRSAWSSVHASQSAGTEADESALTIYTVSCDKLEELGYSVEERSAELEIQLVDDDEPYDGNVQVKGAAFLNLGSTFSLDELSVIMDVGPVLDHHVCCALVQHKASEGSLWWKVCGGTGAHKSQPELGGNPVSLRAPNRPLSGSVAFLGHLGLNTVQKSKGKAKNPLNGARQ